MGKTVSEIRLRKQKDMAKGEKKAKEILTHQASSRRMRLASGLGRWGPRTATCPMASKG